MGLLQNGSLEGLFSVNTDFMTVTLLLELPVWIHFYEKQSKHPIFDIFIS